MSTLRLKNVSISLNQYELLRVSANIGPGQCLTVMGPSGSGKSSLLAYVGGFLDSSFTASGDIWLKGELLNDKPAHLRNTGVLFQDPLLFPHMSVGENLLFAIPPAVKGKARTRMAEQALHQVGLDGFFERDPATLSGGQKARVALMRVLLSQPAALLLDEPFSKLDASRRSQIRQLVFAEAKRLDLPTLLVTHDAADAEAAGGTLVDLEK